MSDAMLVRGRWVVAAADEPGLTDGAVAVQGGTIAAVGAYADLRARYPEAEVLGSERFAVIPGLINAHHHSAGVSYLQHGVADRLLEPWIMAMACRRSGDAYLDTLLSAARLLRCGVTSVVDVHSGGGTAEAYAARAGRALKAYDEAGMRVAFAIGYSEQSHLIAGEDEAFLASLPDDVKPIAEAYLPGPERLDRDDFFGLFDDLWQAHKHHPRIDLWLAPPGPQWVADDFMQQIGEAARRYGCGIQTHVEESFYEKLHGPRCYGKPTVEHLRDLGVLSPHFSLAHGVWLSEPEIAILAETGAAVSHNPSSNLRLRAGIAPLNALLAGGATTALGMDGTTLNDDEDMFTEMRLALRLHRTPRLDGPAPEPAQVFALATVGGAKLMRQETRLGRLAPDFAADLVLLDLERITWPWVAPEADPRDLILMRARADDVHSVLVEGEVVVRDGRPTRFDAAAAGAELAERMAAAAVPDYTDAILERLLPLLEAHYLGWEAPELEPYDCYNARR